MIHKEKKVLVCIFSVYDEKCLEDILNKIPKAVANYEHEILMLIDGSREAYFQSAVKTIESFKLFNVQMLFVSKELGYGENQKLAFYYAIKHKFDVVLSLDGSGQYSPEDLKRFLAVLDDSGAHAVVGSRFLNTVGNKRLKISFYRYFGNKMVSFFQNLILDLKFSEFHSGFRGFQVKALEKIPFPFNSNKRQFDTEILIQLTLKGFNVKEIPVSFVGGVKGGSMECIRYGMDVLKLSINFRLHKMSLFYERKFDVSFGVEKYTFKKGYPSSHQFALDEVRGSSRVLDIGCGNSLVGAELKKFGCWVEAIDCESPKGLSQINKFTKMNLNDENISLPVHNFDYVLLLDVLEHLEDPERFVLNLRTQAMGKSPRILVSVPNVAFFVMRVQLFLGRFNYGIRGILDIGHRRLFTFNTIRKMLEDAGFKILKCTGIPAPYPEAIRNKLISRSLLKVNCWLLKLFPKMFSYQIFMVVVPLPTLDELLKSSKKTMN